MSTAAPMALLYSLLLGAALGSLFTFSEMLRILLGLGKPTVFLLDILFCLAAAVSGFILALAVSAGQLRFYQAGCELLGFLAVYTAITDGVRRRLLRLMHRIRKKKETEGKTRMPSTENRWEKSFQKRKKLRKNADFFRFCRKKSKKRLE